MFPIRVMRHLVGPFAVSSLWLKTKRENYLFQKDTVLRIPIPVSDTKPSTSSDYDTRIGDRSVDQLLNQAWNQNFSGTKKRRVMPPWFRQGDSAAGRLPPGEQHLLTIFCN